MHLGIFIPASDVMLQKNDPRESETVRKSLLAREYGFIQGIRMKEKFMRILIMGLVLFVSLATSQVAHATFTVTLDQVGSNVVANGSGSINLTDLTFVSSLSPETPLILPASSDLAIGGLFNLSFYKVIFTGPTTFGSGGITLATSSNGNVFGFLLDPNIEDELTVPEGYTSGTFLFDTMSFDNTTLSGLGVTPGIYTWTWGTGANADSIVLDAGVSATPEPPTVWLMATGMLGMFGWAGYRKMRASA